MCGIYGFAAQKPHQTEEIVEGLRDLEYRGYDSWGVAKADNDGVTVSKDVGPVPRRDLGLGKTDLGIGHTRWATHGGVTPQNAHPHVDEAKKIAVVHNGIIENFAPLRQELKKRGHVFTSETDSEVITHLYEEARQKERDPFTAFRQVWRQLEGLNAIVVLDSGARRLLFGRRGSPLAVGKRKDGYVLASDGAALAGVADQVVFLEDGWLGWISATEIAFFTEEGRALHPVWRKADALLSDEVVADSGHHMLREIGQQPAVLQRLAQTARPAFTKAAKMIRSADNVFLLGCGTAFHAALAGESLLLAAGIPARAILASEATAFTPFVGKKTVVITLSQSGETIDVIEPLTQWKKQGAQVISIINSPFSTLDRMADLSLHLQAGREKAVASTKAFTAKLAALTLLRAELRESFFAGLREVHNASELAMEWLDSPQNAAVVALAKRLKKSRDQFFLGRGIFWTIARESALKVKEISYLHAEGMAAGELKHGTLALVEEGVPCFLFGSTQQKAETVSTAMELRARGGLVIGVTPYESEAFSLHLPLPEDEGLSQWVVASMIGQILAYHLSVERGLDPDKPRNLAKSVTVK